MCVKHHRLYKRLARESMQRRREARRVANLCVWCPGDKPAGATPGSNSCLACRVRRNRIRVSDAGVRPGVNPGDRQSRIASRTITHADGRTRYHGQSRRGQQSHAQLDGQDIGFAERDTATGKSGLALYATEVARTKAGDREALPRIQRDDLRSAACHKIEQAIGHLGDVLDRHGHVWDRHGRRDDEEGDE